jgi:hypothetical protein
VKEKFNDAEWAGVVQAPMLAGFAVTAADPGGLISAVQESAAVAGSLKDALSESEARGLASEIVEALKTSEGRDMARDGVGDLVKGRKPAEASEAAVTRLGEIMRSVESKAPAAADGFRTFLMETATRTAEASTEGGFLGFGGETVSDAERKTLDQLRAALAARTG